MKLAHFACAVGRHRVDDARVGKVFGMQVGPCRTCSTPLEEIEPGVWAVQRLRDAGLGSRWL